MSSSSRYAGAGFAVAVVMTGAVTGGLGLASSAVPLAAPAGPATAVMTGIETGIAECMSTRGFRYDAHVPLHAALDDAVTGTPDLRQRDRVIAQVRATHPADPNPGYRDAATAPGSWAAAETTCRNEAWDEHLVVAQGFMSEQDRRSVRKSSLDVSDRLGSGNPGPRPAPPAGAPAGSDPVEHYLVHSPQYVNAIAAYSACVRAAGLPAVNPAEFGNAYTHSGGSGIPSGLSSTARRTFIERADATDRACIGPVAAARDDVIARLSMQP